MRQNVTKSINYMAQYWFVALDQTAGKFIDLVRGFMIEAFFGVI